MPKVSVIIPTHNDIRYIAACLDSVLSQTFEDFEIVIVDDSSSDCIKDVIGSYLNKGIRNIRYFHLGPCSLSAARHEGVKSSSGEFVAFLDSDDIWLPDKLRIQVKLLETDPGLGMVYSNVYFLIGKRSFLDNRKCYSGMVFDKLIEGNFICISTALIRRECIEKAGNFDVSLTNAEDYDIWLRIAKLVPVSYIDMPLVRYRCHRDNMGRGFENDIRYRIYVLEKLLAREDISEEEKKRIRQMISKWNFNLGIYLIKKATRLNPVSALLLCGWFLSLSRIRSVLKWRKIWKEASCAE